MKVEVTHFSFSEAGRILGVDRQTVADAVRKRSIPVHDHPDRGNAKAINEAGLLELSEVFKVALAASA